MVGVVSQFVTWTGLFRGVYWQQKQRWTSFSMSLSMPGHQYERCRRVLYFEMPKWFSCAKWSSRCMPVDATILSPRRRRPLSALNSSRKRKYGWLSGSTDIGYFVVVYLMTLCRIGSFAVACESSIIVTQGSVSPCMVAMFILKSEKFPQDSLGSLERQSAAAFK